MTDKGQGWESKYLEFIFKGKAAEKGRGGGQIYFNWEFEREISNSQLLVSATVCSSTCKINSRYFEWEYSNVPTLIVAN